MSLHVLQGAFLDSRGAVRNGWRALGFYLLFSAAGRIVSPLVYGLLPGREVPSGPWLDALLCLAVTWLCLRLEGEPLESVGLRLDWISLRDGALGAFVGFGIMALSAAGVLAADGFYWIPTPGRGLPDLLAGAWLYLAVGCFEELLFRGYAFQRSVRGLGFALAQGLFAALFAFSHWDNPGMAGGTLARATLNIALAGALLGLCWQRTGSLALPIGIHLGWNWTQGTLFGFGVSGTGGRGWWTPVLHGQPEWLTGGAFGLEGSLVCTLACGLAILGVWRWKGRPSGGASRSSGS